MFKEEQTKKLKAFKMSEICENAFIYIYIYIAEKSPRERKMHVSVA